MKFWGSEHAATVKIVSWSPFISSSLVNALVYASGGQMSYSFCLMVRSTTSMWLWLHLQLPTSPTPLPSKLQTIYQLTQWRHCLLNHGVLDSSAVFILSPEKNEIVLRGAGRVLLSADFYWASFYLRIRTWLAETEAGGVIFWMNLVH